MPTQAVKLNIIDCTFGDDCDAVIIWDQRSAPMGQGVCRIIGSRITYRLALRGTPGPPDQSDRQIGARIDLRLSHISGELDLRELRVRWVNLNETILTGSVRMRKESLQGPFLWRRFYQFAIYDRPGVLLKEQVYAGAEPYPADWAPLDKARREDGLPSLGQDITGLAEEYEKLRNAFVRDENMDWWEQDFCHYKCRDYRRRVQVASLGQKCLAFQRHDVPVRPNVMASNQGQGCIVAACGIFMFFALSVTLSLILGSFAWAIVSVSLLLAVAIMCPCESPTFLHVLSVCFDWLVMKWLVGYGVLITRLLVSVVLLIFLFAAFYGLVTGCRPEWGSIVDSKGCSILCKERFPPGALPKNYIATQLVVSTGPPLTKLLWCADNSWAKLQPGEARECVDCYTGLRRLWYFSVSTFTTLGYGDYHPEGNLQFVAGAEALVGIVMMSLITVVFARKFLR